MQNAAFAVFHAAFFLRCTLAANFYDIPRDACLIASSAPYSLVGTFQGPMTIANPTSTGTVYVTNASATAYGAVASIGTAGFGTITGVISDINAVKISPNLGNSSETILSDQIHPGSGQIEHHSYEAPFFLIPDVLGQGNTFPFSFTGLITSLVPISASEQFADSAATNLIVLGPGAQFTGSLAGLGRGDGDVTDLRVQCPANVVTGTFRGPATLASATAAGVVYVTGTTAAITSAAAPGRVFSGVATVTGTISSADVLSITPSPDNNDIYLNASPAGGLVYTPVTFFAAPGVDRFTFTYTGPITATILPAGATTLAADQARGGPLRIEPGALFTGSITGVGQGQGAVTNVRKKYPVDLGALACTQ